MQCRPISPPARRHRRSLSSADRTGLGFEGSDGSVDPEVLLPPRTVLRVADSQPTGRGAAARGTSRRPPSAPLASGKRSGSASSRRRDARHRSAGSMTGTGPDTGVRDVSRRPTRSPWCWPIAGSGGYSLASCHSLRPFATQVQDAVIPRLSLAVGVHTGETENPRRPLSRKAPGASRREEESCSPPQSRRKQRLRTA